MKQFSIIILMSLITLLGGVGDVWAQTKLTTTGGDLPSGSYIIRDGNHKTESTITIKKGNNVTIDLNGYVLYGDFKSSGYVLSVEDGATLTIKDTRPTLGHKGYLNDEGLFVWPYVDGNDGIAVGGGIIYNKRKADINTKGISVAGTCIIECAKIMGCYAGDIGAAVTITSSGRFTMQKGEIRYNYTKSAAEETTTRAGVVYGEPSHNNSGSLIDISNTIISDNKTEGNGGAICGYNVKLSNCTIERNVTTKNGGAVYLRRVPGSLNDASLTIASCNISHNCAYEGGGIYSQDGASITINGGTTISWNKAAINGGGIYTYSPLSIKGTATAPIVIEMNEARSGGGIIASIKKNSTYQTQDPDCTIEYCKIKDNWAYANGGGIFSYMPTKIINSEIVGNRAMSSETEDAEFKNLGRGGGFYFSGSEDSLDAGPEFEIINTDVLNNAAMYYGGGGQACNGAIFTLTNSKINDNVAVLHGAGGLHLTSSAHFKFASGDISNNIAHSVGGAIHSSYTCQLDLTGGTISDNTVYGRGGGVHVNTGGQLNLQGTIIKKNIANDGYDFLYSTVSKDPNTGIVSWTDPKSGNDTKVLGYGGGVVVDSGTCEMNSGELNGNYAQSGGGGIALVMINMSVNSLADFKEIKVVNFTLNDGKILNNSTAGDGGGIYLMKNRSSESLELIKGSEVYDQIKEDTEIAPTILNGIPKISIYGGTLSKNVAQKDGGGAFQDENTEFLVYGESTDISKNEAAGSGGAVYISKGTATLEGGKIYGNKAKENGGALYVNGNLSVTNGLVNNNSANNGGGICLEGGNVTISDGEIHSNIASQNGGGLYVYNSSDTERSVSFSGGTFENNEAKAGGGVAVEGKITLTIENTDFQGNSAENGGGVYMNNGAKMSYISGLIRSNTAKSSGSDTGATGGKGAETGYQLSATAINGFGGGVFMDSNTTLTFGQAGSAQKLGLYGNSAYNGADDIFANGNNTSVQLPNVTEMELSDFRVPVEKGNLYWVKDYVTNDSQYTKTPVGTDGVNNEVIGSTNTRYRYALSNLKENYYKLDQGKYDGYISVALGYEIIYITIKKNGMQDDDSAIFKISKVADDATVTPYISLVISSKNTTSQNGALVKKIALPAGKWTISEDTNWSWAYSTSTSSYTREITQSTSDNDRIFEFTNTLKSDTPNLRDETIIVNTFKVSSN